MIFVLYGPPGVGKSYIGSIVGHNTPFFYLDADTLITEHEKNLLRKGKYQQSDRNKFINRLINRVGSIRNKSNVDVLISESFTKKMNRDEFARVFDKDVCFILIRTMRELAFDRAMRREKCGHVINKVAFDQIWDEFDWPKNGDDCFIIDNYGSSYDDLLNSFNNIVNIVKR